LEHKDDEKDQIKEEIALVTQVEILKKDEKICSVENFCS